MKAGEAWALIKESVTAWMDDYAPSMGAALAYYTVFSIAPLLIIVISVAGIVFGHDAVQGQIVAQLGGLVGDEGAAAIEGLIKSASEPARGILGTIIGVAVLIIGATSVVTELQSALDRIWEVPCEDRPNGLMGLLRTRLVAFGLVLGLGFLALVSLILSAGVAAFGAWFGGMFEDWEVLLQALNLTISVALSAAPVRDDLQADAERTDRVARRVDRRRRDRHAVRDRQDPDRALYRQERRHLGLRRRRFHRRAAGVGLLLGADLPAGRRVHLGLCAPSWLARRPCHEPSVSLFIQRSLRRNRMRTYSKIRRSRQRPAVSPC